MRNTVLAAAAAFVIGGATVGSLISYAQPAPPPGPGAGGMDGPGADPGDPGPMAGCITGASTTVRSRRAPSRWCIARRTAT